MDRLMYDLNYRLSEKDRLIAEREKRIEELLHSMSWRVTGPLRSAFEALLKLRKN
jgi:hypothetical protein